MAMSTMATSPWAAASMPMIKPSEVYDYLGQTLWRLPLD